MSYGSEGEEWDGVVRRMFVYANSNQMDHFYSMLTQRQWEKVMALTGVEGVERFQEMPRTYIRLVFILTNFAFYSR